MKTFWNSTDYCLSMEFCQLPDFINMKNILILMRNWQEPSRDHACDQVPRLQSGSLCIFSPSVTSRRSSWTSPSTCTSDSSGATTGFSSMGPTSGSRSWWWGRSTLGSSGSPTHSLSMRRWQLSTRRQLKTSSLEFPRVGMCYAA